MIVQLPLAKVAPGISNKEGITGIDAALPPLVSGLVVALIAQRVVRAVIGGMGYRQQDGSIGTGRLRQTGINGGAVQIKARNQTSIIEEGEPGIGELVGSGLPVDVPNTRSSPVRELNLKGWLEGSGNIAGPNGRGITRGLVRQSRLKNRQGWGIDGLTTNQVIDLGVRVIGLNPVSQVGGECGQIIANVGPVHVLSIVSGHRGPRLSIAHERRGIVTKDGGQISPAGLSGVGLDARVEVPCVGTVNPADPDMLDVHVVGSAVPSGLGDNRNKEVEAVVPGSPDTVSTKPSIKLSLV